MKCKICGGPCTAVGEKFKCDYCGSIFSFEELNTCTKTIKQSISGTDIFDKNINGILEIGCRGEGTAWSGSGYLVSALGYAITNAHVAAEESGAPCNNMRVIICGCSMPATVVALADNLAGKGTGYDLAIIKLSTMPQNATPLKIDVLEPKNGETVFAIGNSLGEGTCITRGIVSDKNREVKNKSFIMTDCAVNGGNSGGPLFNEKGLVIGTITMQGRTRTGADAEGMNYAIPAVIVRKFIDAVSQKLGIKIL